MKEILSILGAFSDIGKVLAIAADPKRREVVKLRLAIEAAEHLLMIKDRTGIYKEMSTKYLEKYLVHWNKRWMAYKDGV